MKKCNECSFNHAGKCIVAMPRVDKMNDGKRSEYQSYLSIESIAECSKFKPYVTRLRDANK